MVVVQRITRVSASSNSMARVVSDTAIAFRSDAPDLQVVKSRLAMTASFGPTGTASSGSTLRWRDGQIWPHPRLPRSLIVAGAHRTSRSFVLASLRALHLDLQLVASDQAAAEEGALQDGGSPHPRGGAISSRHRECPIRGVAT